MKKLLLLLFCTCISQLLLGQRHTDSVKVSITVTSDNLSEDMSRLSTGNDELILLGYRYDSNSNLNAPFLIKEFVFDKRKKELTLTSAFYDTTMYNAAYPRWSILLVLIERDSRVSVKRIEPVVRIHHRDIENLYKKRKTVLLEDYLGDEDLLLFCNISIGPQQTEKCADKYISNLDSYSYQMEVKKIR